MSRPTIICVPGASHTAAVFEPLRAALAVDGYNVAALTLPSLVGPGSRPTWDFTEDVIAIRDIVGQCVQAEQEVIVVLHAYAGLPGGEALLPDLGRTERERRGARGGVIRIIFIMSWVAHEGFQSSPRGDIASMFPYMYCDIEGGTVQLDPEAAISYLYNDLPAPEAAYWASQLLPHSIGVFWSRTSYAAWRYIPSTYVLCAQDQSVPLEYAEMMLRAAQTSRPNMIDTVERCAEAGQAPFLSQVRWTANMLRRAAGENTG